MANVILIKYNIINEISSKLVIELKPILLIGFELVSGQQHIMCCPSSDRPSEIAATQNML